MNRRASQKVTLLSIALALSLSTAIAFGILFFTRVESTEAPPQWEMEPISEAAAAADGEYDPMFMKMAFENAFNASAEHKGGPIGAVIVKDGEVIASTSNENRLTGHDYSHAELCAIRDAQDLLGTKNLDGCIIYTSLQPCLMCESAIAGANIKKVYYAATLRDALEYGWNDIAEYETIQRGENLVESYAIDVENKLAPLDAKLGNK